MTPRKGPIGHLLTAAVRFIGWLIFAIHDARQRRFETARQEALAQARLLHRGCKCGQA
ncbi:hypothetical protein SEA_WHEELBITE_35 [Arthrobacter phage Wheelbite]|uniref:Uncharacterized protein n=1 Tax=Arthrobacter phage Wheelbite TaxID=2015873 RepID=A0A222ZI39_9CAUD|nr:hypothetical protein KMD23_gp35 [Arthrobacter phage Wheelbite]ASR84128.1 hypothetical protein SEA_WHEELBITE_35 [Arthrobacter phage Wheelbite]